MSVVQKARMYHMNSAPQFLGVLKHINVKKIVKQKSLEQLQQLTNTCERFSINSNWYAKQNLQNKIKYLQAYQFSLYYSKNLKNIYHQKQKQLQQKRDLLKRNVDQKKKQIKAHKKKVQQMKHDYRDMKINTVKKVYNQYEDKLFALRRQQDQLHEMNVRMQQQMERAKYEMGSQFYHSPAYNNNNILPGVRVDQNQNMNLNINGASIKNGLQDNLRSIFSSNFQNQREGSGSSSQNFNNINNPPFSSPIQNPLLQVSKKESKGEISGIKNPPLNKNNNNKNSRVNNTNQQLNYFDLQQQSNHNSAPQQLNSVIRLRVSSQSNKQYAFKDSKKQIIRSTEKKDSLVLIDQYNQQQEKEKQSMMYGPTIKINNKKLLTKNMNQQSQNQDGSQSFGQLNQNSKHSINASLQKKQEDQFTKKHSILKQTQKTNKTKVNIRYTGQSYQQQQKDTVAQLDNGIYNNKNSPISLPKSSSIIKKGDDSNIFKGDNSFFDIKLNLDSKISNNDQKSSLMQSKSRISDSDESNKTYSFNLKNQKKKSSIQSDPRQSQNLNQQDLIQSKKLKQAQSLRLSQIEIDDRNLYSSNKGTQNQTFKSRLAFNKPPKRKNVSELNLKLSEVSNAQQKEELIQTIKHAKDQKQENQQENDEKDDDDFDQVGFGLGQKSVISKKNQKQKVSSIVIGKNNQEQNKKKQVFEKIQQKISVKAPPQLPKQRYDGENQYGQDFQDQYKPNDNNQPLKNIYQQNNSKQQSKKNTIESRQRSKVDISISPNHSYTDVIKQQTQFAELEDQAFKLKPQQEYINGIFNLKQNDTKDNEKKGIITSVLKSVSVKNLPYIQSKVNIDIDFLEDFDMPMHSVIGKKPNNIKNSNINRSKKQQPSKISIRVVGNDGNVVSNQQVPKSLKDLLELQRKKTQPQKNEDQEDYQGQQFEQLPEMLESNTGEYQQSQNVKEKLVNMKDKKNINPISVQMIQSKTFQFGKDSQKQRKSIKLGLDNLSLFLPMTKSVLESKSLTMGNNQKQAQGQGQVQVQEQIQFNLQDGSKVQQFQKQQLQKKIIRMIRNKNKLAQDKQQKSKSIQQKIMLDVQRQIQQATNKKINKITNWKNVHDIFAKQIQQIKKKQTISQRKLDQKLSEINKKIKQQIQKTNINDSQKDLNDDQLNYSTSMIKNSFLNSNINKTKTDQIKQNDNLNFSLRQKSRFQMNKIAQIKQQQGSSQLNNIGKQTSSNKQPQKIQQTFKPQIQYKTIQSEQFRQQKSSRQNNLMGQEKSKTIEQQGKNNQTSKSKYAKVNKSITPKNATKQTVISKIQQNKYTAMEDPLAKDISKASNMFNAKKSLSNQEEDDF